MSNAKRFLSVILAMIMMCSTLVIGANAAYTAYKDSAIGDEYNSLDTPVLTTEQYASAAMDEVDRMLNKEQLKFTRSDIMVGEADLTSIDAAMDSVYTLVSGRAWTTFSGMLGDLKNLNASAFRTETQGGVRRSTKDKTDTDIIYAVIQFLYDNKDLVVSFVNGTLDLGTIVSSFVDISEFADVNKLIKGMLYEATYQTDAPSNVKSITVDTMVQDLIDNTVVPLVPALEGHTNISTGTAYSFIDDVLKQLYNSLLVDLLNDNVKYEINKFCGVVYTKDDAGNITDTDKSNLNAYASLINIDYEVPQYTFPSGTTFVNNLNNIIKSILDVMLNSSVYVWKAGDNSMLLTNITGLAKAVLVNTGDDFFASYIHVATPEEVNAMSTEELCVYALRAIINGSVHGMYIPEDATTIREFGYYALSQLLATSVPELDFSSYDKNSTDTLIVMAVNYAIYSINSAIDMDLSYVDNMKDVDDQITKAINYGINNYGGLLNGITFDTSTSASGWDNLNILFFSIIKANWLPTAANGDMKTFIIDCLINNILDLDFDSLIAMFNYRSDSELQSTPKQVVINLVTRIVNIIFPGAIASATSLEALATNSALASTVGVIFNCLQNYRTKLVASILPTLCDILELTSAQDFSFPDITYEEMVYASSKTLDYKINIRNSSSGINTGYTDSNGVFQQDSLYTYDIKSVTSNVTSVNLTNPGTLSGGKSADIRVTGSFSADTVFVVAITYDVLTERGTALTESPITEYIYSYLACSADSDNKSKLTATSGNFSITDGPLNVYASSMKDLYGMQLTVESASTADSTMLPVSDAVSKLVTENGTAYLELKSDPVTLLRQITDDEGTVNKGIAKTYVMQTTEAYDALTAEEKEAVWQSMITKGMTVVNGTIRMYARYKCTTGVSVNGTTTVQNGNNYIFLYDDYDLGSLLSSEMGKHRQSSAYSDASAWTAYTAAMQQAAKAVYSPFKTGTFAGTSTSTGKAVLYKPAYEALTAAIEALDASAISQGVDSTKAIINSINPGNDEGIEYDNPNYNFFGVSDYVAYTYYNYKTEYKAAQAMINSATVPDETTGEVAIINALTLAYTNHRLSLYGSRLLQVAANNSHLASALAKAVPMSDESKYSTESWDNYIRAYNFATIVIGEAVEAGLKQSRVNTALEELIEAQKRLVAPTGSGGDTPTFTLLNPETQDQDDLAVTVYENSDGETLLLGVRGFDEFSVEEYFNCTGCHIDVTLTGDDNLGTGSVIEIKSDATNAVIATYIVVVAGDVTGDGFVDNNDLSDIELVSVSLAEFSESCESARDFASDMLVDGDHDGMIDVYDLSEIEMVATGLYDMDFANRAVLYN